MKKCKKLYVVFSTVFNEVAFITNNKNIVELFFERKSRSNSYFYKCVKDREHIEMFIRDFSDKMPECAGSAVMLDYEYIDMCEAIQMLIQDLRVELTNILTNLKYLKLTDDESKFIIKMCEIIYRRISSYENDDFIDIETVDELFDPESIMNRYLDDIGV